MIPNFKTDLKEFGRTMLQIGSILLALLVITAILLVIIIPSGDYSEELVAAPTVSQPSTGTPTEVFYES